MILSSHPDAQLGRSARVSSPLCFRLGVAARPLAALSATAAALAAAAAGMVRSALVRVGASRLEPPDPVAAEPIPSAPAFAELVYELLDAHADTAELASEFELGGDWLAHMEHLRTLQRQGREVLAQMSVEASP